MRLKSLHEVRKLAIRPGAVRLFDDGHLDEHIREVLASHGFRIRGFFGDGAEGRVYSINDNRVAKIWYGDPQSARFWFDVYNGKFGTLSVLPRVYWVGMIDLMMRLAVNDRKPINVPVTVAERVRPLPLDSSGIKVIGHPEINRVIAAANRLEPIETDDPKIKELGDGVIKLKGILGRNFYIGAQVGIASDGRLVIYDLY